MDVGPLLRGSVARMHCTATVLGARTAGGDTGEGRRDAEALVSAVIPEALAELLADAFATERVVVVRDVRCTASAVLSHASVTPSTVGRALAHELTRDLSRKVYGGQGMTTGDHVEVVTFASTAEFVGEFLAQLVLDGTGDRWYFEPFDGYRGLPLRDVVADLHREMPELMPAIW